MGTKILHRIGPVIGIVLVAAALWVLGHELRQYRYHDVVRALLSQPPRHFLQALLLTLLSYLALTGYDTLAFRYIRHPMRYRKIAAASFIGYAFSHNLGLSLLTGGSVRFRLYSIWGLSAIEITKIVAFCSLTLWLGFFAIAGTSFVLAPITLPQPLQLPFGSVRILGLIMWAAILGYVLLAAIRKRPVKVGEWELSLPSLQQSVAQLIVSAADWACAAGVLYMLLPDNTGITYPAFLGIFLLAQITGIVSQVPGGLGVFETVIMLLMSGAAPAPAILGSLVAYRAVYYLLPLGVAATLLGVHELLGARRVGEWVERIFGRWIPAIAPHVLAAGAFLGGAILLFSGATPTVHSRLWWLERSVPLPIVEVSHFIGSLAGMGLLLLARGLQRRLDGAYYLAAVLLSVGIIVSLLKGFDYEEAFFLSLMLLTLLPCHRHFYRRASLVSERFTAEWIVAIGAIFLGSVWVGFFSYKHVEYSHDLWWRFAVSADAPRFLRASVGAVAVLLVFGLARLLRRAPVRTLLPEATDLERARAILSACPRTLGNLALLGDKSMLFSERRDAFLMYAVEGRSWVSLGDPVGAKGAWPELVWEFRELCDEHDGWAAFYQVQASNLHLYLDLGLSPLKIGEEARVSLDRFNLDGHNRKSLRHSHTKVAKTDCTFEIIPAEGVPSLLGELRGISDAWLELKSTREKGFSVGFFSDEYLHHFPAALVRQGGRIVAFGNLWLGSGKEELSIDLMRHTADAPNGTMDYLFIELMLWGKREGYRWFNLGVAPMSGMEDRPLAPLWHRMGALLFRQGEHFYNFQGLRQYKEKFDPVWEPVYLFSPGGLALPRLLANIATLIAGGIKGVVAK